MTTSDGCCARCCAPWGIPHTAIHHACVCLLEPRLTLVIVDMARAASMNQAHVELQITTLLLAQLLVACTVPSYRLRHDGCSLASPVFPPLSAATIRDPASSLVLFRTNPSFWSSRVVRSHISSQCQGDIGFECICPITYFVWALQAANPIIPKTTSRCLIQGGMAISLLTPHATSSHWPWPW